MNISKPIASIVLITFIVLFSVPLSAQNTEDTTGKHFTDDLLDHLVGEWNDTSIAHGSKFTSHVDIKWVLNHQYAQIQTLFNILSGTRQPTHGIFSRDQRLMEKKETFFLT